LAEREVRRWVAEAGFSEQELLSLPHAQQEQLVQAINYAAAERALWIAVSQVRARHEPGGTVPKNFNLTNRLFDTGPQPSTLEAFERAGIPLAVGPRRQSTRGRPRPTTTGEGAARSMRRSPATG
jgi:anti-sigma regulatory factor (Ser/Thr protein kinase)